MIGLKYDCSLHIFHRTKRKTVTENSEWIELWTRGIFDHSFRGVLEINFLGLNYASNFSNGKILSRILPESFSTEMTAMIFPKFHRFYDILNLKLQQLFIGGIINYHSSKNWTHTENAKMYAHLFSDLQGPQILTMKNLEAGFVVWLVSISFRLNRYVHIRVDCDD